MNSTRPTSEIETTRRNRAERRISRALVANYIHELSTRHGRPAERRPRPRRIALTPCEAES